MNDTIEITGTATVTPEIAAELFWNLKSDEQAKFFAHLYRIAGGFKITMQMLYVAQEIAETENADAQMGLSSFSDEGRIYLDTAIHYRGQKALRAIAQMAEKARETL